MFWWLWLFDQCFVESVKHVEQRCAWDFSCSSITITAKSLHMNSRLMGETEYKYGCIHIHHAHIGRIPLWLYHGMLHWCLHIYVGWIPAWLYTLHLYLHIHVYVLWLTTIAKQFHCMYTFLSWHISMAVHYICICTYMYMYSGLPLLLNNSIVCTHSCHGISAWLYITFVFAHTCTCRPAYHY